MAEEEKNSWKANISASRKGKGNFRTGSTFSEKSKCKSSESNKATWALDDGSRQRKCIEGSQRSWNENREERTKRLREAMKKFKGISIHNSKKILLDGNIR